MGILINVIENAIGTIVNNKELIIGGSIIAIVLGVIAGLIIAPIFA